MNYFNYNFNTILLTLTNKFMLKLKLIAICTFLFLGISAFAQTDSTDEGKLTLSGYIDSYYLTSLKGNPSGNLMGNAGATIPNPGYNPADPNSSATLPAVLGGAPVGRAFDRLTNQFALGLVQIKAMYSNKRSDMVIDLTFGPNAELGNFGNGIGSAKGVLPTNGYQLSLYGSGISIKQAYWTYKATSKLSFTVGQFGTHIGYEVIDAPVNYHYSLSNLFNNGPFYHVGAKANYAFSDNVGLMVGVVNNWDAMTDYKKQKSIIAQLYLKPAKGFNVYLNYIGGFHDDGYKVNSNLPGATGAVASSYSGFGPDAKYSRHLWDLTTGYQITDKFYLGINAAWGFYSGDSTFKSNAKARSAALKKDSLTILPWGGVAVYANYQITDMIGIGARFEHFQDKYEVRYLGATNNSLTITAPITLANGHLIVKPEFRMDASPASFGTKTLSNGTEEKIYYYETKEKNVDGGYKSSMSQMTIGCAFVYKY